MKDICSYCNILHKAKEGQNYCSNQGDSIHNVSSNAYYFRTNKLNSGTHLSRFSVRTVSDGYQLFKTDKKEFLLDNQHYLIINEGESFSSELSTQQEVEGILVAFNRQDFNTFLRMTQNSHTKLLDDPFDASFEDREISSQSIKISKTLKVLFNQIGSDIRNQCGTRLRYDEVFSNVIQQVYKDQGLIEEKIQNLQSEKKSTRTELFKRLQTTKEFIDLNFSDDISLEMLSNVSTLSPYHLIRNYKDFYKISPYAYVSQKRIAKSQFLLRDTDMKISELAMKAGYYNQSSFSRKFKKNIGLTPIEYRAKYR